MLDAIYLLTLHLSYLCLFRHYGAQDKGKEHITAIPSMNPTLYNQYQNSYTNIMTPQVKFFCLFLMTMKF